MKKLLCLALLLAQASPAQSISSWNIARWYETPEVRDSRSTNSPRLDGLIKSGHIWLPVSFKGDRMQIDWKEKWDLTAFK